MQENEHLELYDQFSSAPGHIVIHIQLLVQTHIGNIASSDNNIDLFFKWTPQTYHHYTHACIDGYIVYLNVLRTTSTFMGC